MRRPSRSRATLLLCVIAMVAGVATGKEKATSAADCFTSAFRTGNADAVAACYAVDAIMWFPGGPLAQGRPAIREGFAGFFEKWTIKDVTLRPIGHERMGNAMTSWGTYAIRMVDKATGAETTENGRFTDVSRKIGGHWLYVVDHPSDDPPPAVAK